MILLSFCLDLAIVALGALGTLISLRINGWGMFRFYTLDSNLLLLFACAAQAWYEANILIGRRLFVPSWARVLKYLAVCTTTVTFFVVLFILTPLYGGLRVLPYMLTEGSMLYHHLLCPVLGFVSFVFLDRVSLPDRRVTLWALAPTALYAAVSVALNALGLLRGPYPFLYVHEQPVWRSALWCAVILALAWALALLVRRLSLKFSEPREAEDAPPEALGWTEDGYIKNQECFSAHTYRTIPANNNSCGPVAVYNLRRHEGHDARFPDVLAEMDGLHLLRVPGPTLMYVMRSYLRRHLPGWREARGRAACLAAAAKSRMGVFRYHEQRIPHFVAYFRTDSGGAFRFLNIWDDAEDVTLTMDAFGREHLLGGSVRLIYWE